MLPPSNTIADKLMGQQQALDDASHALITQQMVAVDEKKARQAVGIPVPPDKSAV